MGQEVFLMMINQPRKAGQNDSSDVREDNLRDKIEYLKNEVKNSKKGGEQE